MWFVVSTSLSAGYDVEDRFASAGGRRLNYEEYPHVSDFGTPPFSGAFGRMPTPQLKPPAGGAGGPGEGGRRGGSSFMMGFFLMLACLGLGAALAWGLSLNRERARLSERTRGLEEAYTVVIAQRDDVAAFLTDPQTQLFTLSGRGAASGRSITLAWSSARQTGFVIGDRMPLPGDAQVYRIWMGMRSEGATRFVAADRAFRPEAGLTCFEFHAIGRPGGAGLEERFMITAETDRRSGVPAGAIAYEDRGAEKAASRPAVH